MSLIERSARLGSRVYREIIASLPNERQKNSELILERLAAHGIPASLDFDIHDFKNQVMKFVNSMATGQFSYRYAPSVATPTLYSSVYACLTMSIFDEIDSLSPEDRRGWAEYFDSFQSAEDGLYRDPAMHIHKFEDMDWWGGRHLALHMIAAYAALGHVPRHPFIFLESYKSETAICRWLDAEDWNAEFGYNSDVDNKIMNITCALQFERDYRGDARAGDAVACIQAYLSRKTSPDTCLWGTTVVNDSKSLSRAIQFAYHLYSIFFYDNRTIKNLERLIDFALLTQNAYGGYGVALNSSACEDIDSIDLLCRLSQNTSFRRKDVDISIKRALPWMLSNQNDDGGFVFRRNERFEYGHKLMTSKKNESAMFPTWFRTLAVVYASKHLGHHDLALKRCPGLQF